MEVIITILSTILLTQSIIPNIFTSWARALLEKTTVAHIFKKLLPFITIFIKGSLWIILEAR
jgi:hypothetical protein